MCKKSFSSKVNVHTKINLGACTEKELKMKRCMFKMEEGVFSLDTIIL